MKVNSLRTSKIAQKFLYANILDSYAKLCKTYQTLALDYGKSPEQFLKQYGPILSDAAKGNMYAINNSGYSRDTKQLLTIYAENSRKLGILSDLQKTLARTTDFSVEDKSRSEFAIDHGSEYSEKMRALSTKFSGIRKIDTFIKQHSPTLIGFGSYALARNAIDQIEDIDPEHIPQSLKDKITTTFTPGSFGANVRGYLPGSKFGYIQRLEKNQDKVFPVYSGIQKTGEAIKNGAVAAGQGIKRFYTKHRAAIRKVMAGVLAVGLAATITAGSIRFVSNTRDFNASISSTDSIAAAQMEYDRLLAIENAGGQVSESEYQALRTQVDDLMSDTVAAKLTDAMNEQGNQDGKYAAFNVLDLTPRYAESNADGREEYVLGTVETVSQDGKREVLSVNLTSKQPFAAADPFGKIMDDEHDIDRMGAYTHDNLLTLGDYIQDTRAFQGCEAEISNAFLGGNTRFKFKMQPRFNADGTLKSSEDTTRTDDDGSR